MRCSRFAILSRPSSIGLTAFIIVIVRDSGLRKRRLGKWVYACKERRSSGETSLSDSGVWESSLVEPLVREGTEDEDKEETSDEEEEGSCGGGRGRELFGAWEGDGGGRRSKGIVAHSSWAGLSQRCGGACCIWRVDSRYTELAGLDLGRGSSSSSV